MADANTLYAVDSELGELVWQKDFPLTQASHAANIQVVTEAPQVIHFGARKPAPKLRARSRLPLLTNRSLPRASVAWALPPAADTSA